jgi:hypothetical protein
MFETEMVFSRVYDTVRDAYRTIPFTTFGFESDGKRYRVIIDGWPRVESGQRVTALLPSPGKWEHPLGWVCHDTGEVVGPRLPAPSVFRASSVVSYSLMLLAAGLLLLSKGAFPIFALALLTFILGVASLQAVAAKGRATALSHQLTVTAELLNIKRRVTGEQVGGPRQ